MKENATFAEDLHRITLLMTKQRNEIWYRLVRRTCNQCQMQKLGHFKSVAKCCDKAGELFQQQIFHKSRCFTNNIQS